MRWVMYRRPLAGVFEFGFRWGRLQPVLLRSLSAMRGWSQVRTKLRPNESAQARVPAPLDAMAFLVAQAIVPVPQVGGGRGCAKRGSGGMRWVMYRRRLAGVFEFGFCANGEDEKQSRRPEASGTNGANEGTVPRK